MKTLNLEEAAIFLGAHKETIRRQAVCGELPAAKIGKSWRFIEQDLVTHIRNKYSSEASQGVHNRGNKLWHSTTEKGFGGSIYTTKEKEYDKVLGLR